LHVCATAGAVLRHLQRGSKIGASIHPVRRAWLGWKRGLRRRSDYRCGSGRVVSSSIGIVPRRPAVAVLEITVPGSRGGACTPQESRTCRGRHSRRAGAGNRDRTTHQGVTNVQPAGLTKTRSQICGKSFAVSRDRPYRAVIRQNLRKRNVVSAQQPDLARLNRQTSDQIA